MQGIHWWTPPIQGREVEENRPIAGIVFFVKTLKRTSFGHMPMYVIEFVIKIIVICFENNIICLRNAAKRILVNGIGQCGIETHDIHR